MTSRNTETIQKVKKMLKKNWVNLLLLLIFCLSIVSGLFATDSTKKRILIGSPICQKPAILQEFLESLNRLPQDTYTLDYYFIDDNTLSQSRELLQKFTPRIPGKVLVEPANISLAQPYQCDEVSHYWSDDLIWKVAAFKDRMIHYAHEKKYDYLFLIDSDLVLHPKTIDQLIKAKKDIISNVFWTIWKPGEPSLPQVWLFDQYIQYDVRVGEKLSPQEMAQRQDVFIERMKIPGTYEVGGLGACTLISQAALGKGINFRKITNITFWGEDRHFCIRASALGIPLYVDTHYPAYHIYRESNLVGVEDFKKSCGAALSEEQKKKPIKLTLSMVVKNEADHYLRKVLEAAKEYITDAVIIDDASTDNTVQVCEEVLKGIPLRIVRNKESKFSNEINLRKQQWEETIKTNPDWILVLDADQMFEAKFKNEVQALISEPSVDAYCFRLYDFWDQNHYRDDAYWQAHFTYRPFLIRYKPGLTYIWRETPQHCGHFPLNVREFSTKNSELRLKHYGWATQEDRLFKYNRYMQLDPNAKYGWKEQYESILDKNPRLKEWKENTKEPTVAITYGFSGGRLGDNLLSMAHATWLSYTTGLPLIYKPFTHSDRLKLHTNPELLKINQFTAHQKRLLESTQDYLSFFEILHSGRFPHKTVFELSYFPESSWEFTAHPDLPPYMQINWDDPEFIKLLGSLIAPLQTLPKITLPKDRVTVALHIRKGGNFDPPGWEKTSPLKGPPDAFYIDALTYLQKSTPNPLYVYIFTDHRNPSEIKEKIAAAFKDSPIIFECRKGSPPDVLEDFFAMSDFDCLIRSDSNFSLVASKIFPFKTVVSPANVVQKEDGSWIVDRFLVQFGPTDTIKKPLRVVFRK
ncbi:MAG: hypothetical protein JWO53_1010 [Chlamydiia bacterium]|nr:hypothetical protein [Chlamydiia bacterium]